MKNSNITNTLAENFRRQGAIRQVPSFFGHTGLSSPADQMVGAFAAAGLTRSEPSFFGRSLWHNAKQYVTNKPAYGRRRPFTLPLGRYGKQRQAA